MTLPFQKNQPNQAAKAPARQFDPYAKFADLDKAKAVGFSNEQPENGEYAATLKQVRLDDAKNLIFFDFETAEGQSIDIIHKVGGKGWENYLASDIVRCLGLDPKSAEGEEAMAVAKGIFIAEAYGQPYEIPGGPTIEPGTIVGKAVTIVVSQGKEPAPGKKYYPNKRILPAR